MDWTEFLAQPFDAVEVEVQQIWQEVLGRRPIGVFENLIYLGGDSLLAARIAAQISDGFKLEVPVSFLFRAGTIHEYVEVRSLPAALYPSGPLQVLPLQLHITDR